jgi:hypothetical protein
MRLTSYRHFIQQAECYRRPQLPCRKVDLCDISTLIHIRMITVLSTLPDLKPRRTPAEALNSRCLASYLQKLPDYSSILQQHTDDINELVECRATKATGTVYAWVTR